jgi:hypothetical protein
MTDSIVFNAEHHFLGWRFVSEAARSRRNVDGLFERGELP